jgi:uncharacterized protein (TIGR03086 family)
MNEIAERYRNVAAGFTRRVDHVPAGAWDAPAPCEGWAARDVVGHLVEWVPPFLAAGTGIELPAGPPVADDPAGAWHALDGGLQALLDDPATAEQQFDHPMAGRHRLDDAIGSFILSDVLVHTWDLARATGQDESLDAEEVASLYAGMEPLDDVLRASGQFGPRVEVPADADVQTKLLAFTGRRP